MAAVEQTAAASTASSQNDAGPAVTAALADGMIRPNEIDNHLAAAMAAFGEAGGTVSSFRSAYHKGYGIDDADRYGPAMPEVIDLMQRIDDYNEAVKS